MTMVMRSAAALALVIALAGCARDAEPTTFAVPRAAAAEIRMTCPPGTFIGTMTVNCPSRCRGAPLLSESACGCPCRRRRGSRH